MSISEYTAEKMIKQGRMLALPFDIYGDEKCRACRLCTGVPFNWRSDLLYEAIYAVNSVRGIEIGGRVKPEDNPEWTESMLNGNPIFEVTVASGPLSAWIIEVPRSSLFIIGRRLENIMVELTVSVMLGRSGRPSSVGLALNAKDSVPDMTPLCAEDPMTYDIMLKLAPSPSILIFSEHGADDNITRWFRQRAEGILRGKSFGGPTLETISCMLSALEL